MREALSSFALYRLKAPRAAGGVSTGAVNFVQWVIEEKLDPAFFVNAASSTGKYHPPLSNGEGGLVRHTVAVVILAEALAELHELNPKQTSIVLIGALLHDATKYAARVGVERWGAHTMNPHGEIACLELSDNWLPEYREIANAKGFGRITEEDEADLAIAFEAVRDHMVQWAAIKAVMRPADRSPIDRPLLRFGKCRGATRIVAIADYMASRKNVTVEMPSDFSPVETSIADSIAEEFAIEGGAAEAPELITAEELIAEVETPAVVFCVACEGRGTSTSGRKCRVCHGSGEKPAPKDLSVRRGVIA